MPCAGGGLKSRDGESSYAGWHGITPFFDYPPQIRKVIYTTNAIESINMSLRRKIIKNRSSFPTDEAVSKLLYLALFAALTVDG